MARYKITSMEARERVLSLSGARNLRDLGGLPTTDGRITRWRTLYRSAVPSALTPEAQQELIRLGLRTTVDLREDDECEGRPSVFCTSPQIRYRRRPFWGRVLDPGTLPDLRLGYLAEFDLCGDRLIETLRELLEPEGLPALLHCQAGKDRTGVLVALILSAVRVKPQIIIDDFVMTRTGLGESYLEESRLLVLERGGVWEDEIDLFDAPPERMQKTLEYLEQHWGGAERYLLGHGLRQDELERLRELLTEPG